MTRSSQHKKKIHIGILSALGVLLILVSFYTFRSTYYTSHFLPHTEINEIDVSNMTVDQANKKLKDTYSNTTLAIEENGKVWQEIAKSELGYRDDFSDDLSKLLSKQNGWTWGMTYVSAAEKQEIDPVSQDHSKLDATIDTLTTKLNDLNSNRKQTQDATIKKTDDGFAITPEVNGDSIDVDATVKEIKEVAATNEKQIDLNDFKQKAKVTADDKELNQQLTAMNNIAKIKATYSINGQTFQIPTNDLASWLIYSDGKIDLDTDKMTQYVTELGQEYNTSTNDTVFNSTKRGEVNVPTGTYSWTIQTEDEVAALKKQILAGQDFTRSPIVQGSTTADHALIEDTYIEVDLQNQHMWYYKDGKVALETDIVSGKPTTQTPAGVFYVWNKETNSVLKGTNDDGTPYASPVDYWMPIDWTGVGIHDSDWQPEYGGELWKTRGSHGCINTPPSVMKELFGMVEVGTPVLVF